MDFQLIAHGSVWTVISVSDEAKDFAGDHFDVEPWQGEAEHFTTDWRVALSLAERLHGDGWVIALKRTVH